MPVIYFNIDKARNELLKNSIVYTIRHERSTGQAVARKGSFYKFEVLVIVAFYRFRLHHCFSPFVYSFMPMSSRNAIQSIGVNAAGFILFNSVSLKSIALAYISLGSLVPTAVSFISFDIVTHPRQRI